jgi:hypothetical protein
LIALGIKKKYFKICFLCFISLLQVQEEYLVFSNIAVGDFGHIASDRKLKKGKKIVKFGTTFSTFGEGL